ncbi:hypothetical protein B0J11DRAFT_574689 [Dendryphion nanum]|uniref:Uncharacterized protein n=1 Tax=Dendryphion nanum TaxID=256645 RepID=A0A9P9EI94_9PLEO|nr:hypothetical protein B0J11DRAFT_574689 [Dendryphion nanum]
MSTVLCSLLFVLISLCNALGLGIQYDSPIGSARLHRFSSKLTWDNLPNNDVWKDKLGQDERKLSRVAKDAYTEMSELYSVKGYHLDPKLRPTVMTAMAVGSNIFLSSSLKGGSFVYHGNDENNPVWRELRLCQTVLNDRFSGQVPDDLKRNRWNWPRHNNGANCGEIMVLYAFFADRSGDSIGEDLRRKLGDAENELRGAHIVTVKNTQASEHRKGNLRYTVEPSDKTVRFDPCGTAEEGENQPKFFGCFQTTRGFGLRPILELWPEGSDRKTFGDDDIKYKRENEFTDIELDNFRTGHVVISCSRVGGSSSK